jgi:hypothetical protein
LATRVLVVTGDEHRGLEDQVAQLIELGKGLPLAQQLRFALQTLTTVNLGDSLLGRAELRERMGGDTAAAVHLHHAAVDTDRAVEVSAAVATGFPSH